MAPTPTSFGKEGSPPETAIEEHINTLQIPRIGNHGLPALQLYRLGSFATEGELRKRKEDIFSGDNSCGQTLQSDSEQFTDRLLDVSLDIIQALSRDQVDEVVAASVIAELSAAIIARLGKTTRIYIVLDEANAAANAYERSFRDDDGNYYPLLKVILKTWKDILQDMPFIFVVAGSEIPEECFAGEIEWKNFVWKSNTEKQRCYIQQFLPDNLRESVGDPLMQRMWRWVRGRHRFTSACIAVLLENSYAKPFAYLDMIIHRSTGYLPCADLRYPSPIFPFGLLDFEVMKKRQLRSYVHLAVIDPLVSSSNPGFPKKAVKLINEGMGRFTDSRCTDIVIDEPLVIARAVAWFTSCEGGTPASILEYQYFVEHLIDPGMAPRHPPAYLAFALALAFSKSRRISDILLMSRPVPLWSRRAHIVARTRQPNLTLENPVRDVNGTHQTLVTYSTSLTDTLQWLRHSHPTPFCIHVTDATATLIFIVKLSNGGRFWAVMRALYSLGDRKDVTTKIQDTLHSLKPENLFQHPSAHEPSSNIFSALDSLPNICPQVGPHGILPVIAIIGKDVDRNISQHLACR
ncbi:hypothetical protein VNI00_000482 [Paramarasmius palmivorus]|uniref:Uncharacterized protein n=1 Tax=Paramarasmius palmivorus TaxID=297713 RepID=A0AAW0E924_9AGAR